MEGLNQKLQKEWDKKLEDEGLPIIGTEEIPVPPVIFMQPEKTTEEIFESLGIERYMESFINLKMETQKNVLEYVKNQRSSGVSSSDILESFGDLIRRSQKFEEISKNDSDKTKSRGKNGVVGYSKAEKRKISEEVDTLIREMEEIIRGNSKKDVSMLN